MVTISKGAVIQATVAAAYFTERAFAIISGATANPIMQLITDYADHALALPFVEEVSSPVNIIATMFCHTGLIPNALARISASAGVARM
jgi:hypothetical protein